MDSYKKRGRHRGESVCSPSGGAEREHRTRPRVTTGRVCTRTVMRLVGKGTAAGLQGGAEGGAGGVKGAFVQARV